MVSGDIILTAVAYRLYVNPTTMKSELQYYSFKINVNKRKKLTYILLIKTSIIHEYHVWAVMVVIIW